MKEKIHLGVVYEPHPESVIDRIKHLTQENISNIDKFSDDQLPADFDKYIIDISSRQFNPKNKKHHTKHSK